MLNLLQRGSCQYCQTTERFSNALFGKSRVINIMAWLRGRVINVAHMQFAAPKAPLTKSSKHQAVFFLNLSHHLCFLTSDAPFPQLPFTPILIFLYRDLHLTVIFSPPSHA